MLIGIARFADLFHDGRVGLVRFDGSGSFTRTALMDLIFKSVAREYGVIAGRTDAMKLLTTYACGGASLAMPKINDGNEPHGTEKSRNRTARMVVV